MCATGDCDHCRGSGVDPATLWSPEAGPCPDCNGSGRQKYPR